jgi:hypothetical protein
MFFSRPTGIFIMTSLATGDLPFHGRASDSNNSSMDFKISSVPGFIRIIILNQAILPLDLSSAALMVASCVVAQLRIDVEFNPIS